MERDAFKCSWWELRLINEFFPEDISQMVEKLSVVQEMKDQGEGSGADGTAGISMDALEELL